MDAQAGLKLYYAQWDSVQRSSWMHRLIWNFTMRSEIVTKDNKLWMHRLIWNFAEHNETATKDHCGCTGWFETLLCTDFRMYPFSRSSFLFRHAFQVHIPLICYFSWIEKQSFKYEPGNSISQKDCMCAQRRLRSACASAQSDQSLRMALFG